MTDIEDNHAWMVDKLFKPGEAILPTMTPEKVTLLHAVVGMAGEVGELLDLVKKHVFTGHPLDLTKVLNEGGDIEFYMEAFRQAVDIDRELFLNANATKLSKRYTNGYSDQASIERIDTK